MSMTNHELRQDYAAFEAWNDEAHNADMAALRREQLEGEDFSGEEEEWDVNSYDEYDYP